MTGGNSPSLRAEAKQSRLPAPAAELVAAERFVAALLAMTGDNSPSLRAEAKQSRLPAPAAESLSPGCFVAPLLAMTRAFNPRIKIIDRSATRAQTGGWRAGKDATRTFAEDQDKWRRSRFFPCSFP